MVGSTTGRRPLASHSPAENQDTMTVAGKPGHPDKITWSNIIWDIKTSHAVVQPGPNMFDKSNVSVDSSGNLHLRITKNASGKWTCAEIIAPTTYGYGSYTFSLASRVDTLDRNAVLGFFTWSDEAFYANRELDIEFARWGNASEPTNAQYVVQPYSTANHLVRFTQPSAAASTHRIMWQKGHVNWSSIDGAGGYISGYDYSGNDVPVTGDERVHLNFWLFNGAAPADGAAAEVVLSSFTFTR